MTTKVVPGLLIAAPDPEGVAREAAARIGKMLRHAIDARGDVALAISGGESPLPAYRILAADARIDWKRVRVFWVDERAVPPTSDRSNYRWAKESLLDPAKIPANHAHRIPGEAKDLDAAARDYESLVRSLVKVRSDGGGVPAFDLMLLGIGDDGHTASLFPGEPQIDVTDRLFVPVPASADGKREARVTMTVPLIENAHQVVVIAIGRKKQGPLELVWQTHGDVHTTPARIIRGVRGGISWIIDKAAGGLG